MASPIGSASICTSAAVRSPAGGIRGEPVRTAGEGSRPGGAVGDSRPGGAVGGTLPVLGSRPAGGSLLQQHRQGDTFICMHYSKPDMCGSTSSGHTCALQHKQTTAIQGMRCGPLVTTVSLHAAGSSTWGTGWA
jgi:hypothetical protein